MELTPAEQEICADLLLNEADTSANIHERTGISRPYVSTLLGKLADNGFVENKGAGVYRLPAAGRHVGREYIRKHGIPD